MKIAAWETRPLRIALERPLWTAHGEIRERIGVTVLLRDPEGREGRGECAPLPGFGLESLDTAMKKLEHAARALDRDFADLDAALDAVDAALPEAPSARGALDTALHDLQAQHEGTSLTEWLARAEGRRPRARVAEAALLREQQPDALAVEVERALARGARALKLKLGAKPADLDRVGRVRSLCPEDVELRLDANAAWSEGEARDALAELLRFAPSYVEQPVAGIDAMARLRRECGLPLAVDESLCDLAAAEAIARAEAADVWVLKPAVVGGLRPARRIAARGRSVGADVVVSGFLDGPVGAAAARALAAALPGGRPAGLATA